MTSGKSDRRQLREKLRVICDQYGARVRAVREIQSQEVKYKYFVTALVSLTKESLYFSFKGEIRNILTNISENDHQK